MAIEIPFEHVASTANVLTEGLEPALPADIEIYDNTLREGEQPPGVLFRPDEKLAIARALDRMGVHWANVGFPAVSRDELAAVRAVTSAGLRMRTAALSRMLPADIDVAVESGVDLISLFLGSSDLHLRHKLRMSEAQAIERIHALVAHARSSGKLVAFCLEDGSRTPYDRIVRMFEAAQDAGASYAVLADTVGVLTPFAAFDVSRRLSGAVRIPLGVHFHDDLGLALANTVAALQGGARMAHVTVNGVGERSGNACLAELAVLLHVKFGRTLGLELGELHALSGLVHAASGTRPPEHKAVTGRWCFTHESGIHVAGLLASRETYQPYPPSLVGRSHEIVFGKHTGTHSVAYLAALHGIDLDADACGRVLARIKSHGKSEGSAIPDDVVLAWVRSESRTA